MYRIETGDFIEEEEITRDQSLSVLICDTVTNDDRPDHIVLDLRMIGDSKKRS
jgi:hypothetical protein